MENTPGNLESATNAKWVKGMQSIPLSRYVYGIYYARGRHGSFSSALRSSLQQGKPSLYGVLSVTVSDELFTCLSHSFKDAGTITVNEGNPTDMPDL